MKTIQDTGVGKNIGNNRCRRFHVGAAAPAITVGAFEFELSGKPAGARPGPSS